MNHLSSQALPSVVVAAAIVFWSNKILLARRKLDAPQGGLWEFPGGKQEAGETLEECLHRELKEEIDIEVSRVHHFQTLRHQYPEKEVELNFFTCVLTEGSAKAIGCIEVAWVDIHELVSYEFPEADRPVIRKILARGLE